MALAIRLLGPPRVKRDGEAVAFDTRKAMALLAHLALAERPDRARRSAACCGLPTTSIAPGARWEEAAEFLATVVMRLPAWNAALLEVRAHRARATGDSDTARDLFRAAASGFAAAGQPLDKARGAALLGRVAT